MNDETYSFIETVKDRRSAATGAYHKVSGSKSKRCTLPSDHLTPAQKRKLNGPAHALNLNRPATYEELTKVSTSLQFLYLDHLINEFKARRVDLIDMLGVSESTFERMNRKLPGKLIFKGRPRKPDPRWLEFMQGELPAPAPEEPSDEEPAPTPDPAPSDEEPAAAIIKLQEEAEASIPDIPSPTSGQLSFHCTGPALIAALLLHLPDLAGKTEEWNFTLNFTK